jgi:hypothetical protein
MKSMPSADEHRRLGKIEAERARNLSAGSAQQAHLEKARNHESSAQSKEWRDSGLHAPK